MIGDKDNTIEKIWFCNNLDKKGQFSIFMLDFS